VCSFVLIHKSLSRELERRNEERPSIHRATNGVADRVKLAQPKRVTFWRRLLGTGDE
jgi:hypothetical protein